MKGSKQSPRACATRCALGHQHRFVRRPRGRVVVAHAHGRRQEARAVRADPILVGIKPVEAGFARQAANEREEMLEMLDQYREKLRKDRGAKEQSGGLLFYSNDL